MKKSRDTEEQIIGFLRQAEAGMPIKELCRNGGFSDATFYKWRAKFGGMDVSDNGVETHFLGKELAYEAIHVLVGATFPRGIGMGEEEIGIKCLCNSLMLGELLAIICRQCVNAGRKRRQQRNHGI